MGCRRSNRQPERLRKWCAVPGYLSQSNGEAYVHGGGNGAQYELRTAYGKQEHLEETPVNRGYVTVDQYGSGGAVLSRAKHHFFGFASYAPFSPFDHGTELHGDSIYYAPWKFGKEHKTESLNSAGDTTLRSTDNTWEQREAVAWWGGASDDAPPNDPRITSTPTTLADLSPNKVTKKNLLLFRRYSQ